MKERWGWRRWGEKTTERSGIRQDNEI